MRLFCPPGVILLGLCACHGSCKMGDDTIASIATLISAFEKYRLSVESNSLEGVAAGLYVGMDPSGEKKDHMRGLEIRRQEKGQTVMTLGKKDGSSEDQPQEKEARKQSKQEHRRAQVARRLASRSQDPVNNEQIHVEQDVEETTVGPDGKENSRKIFAENKDNGEKPQEPEGSTCENKKDVEVVNVDDTLKIKTPYLAGIANEGNTCFMNAALQFLYNTPEFRQSLLSLAGEPEDYGSNAGDSSVLAAMQAVFARIAMASVIEGAAISIKSDLFKLFGKMSFGPGKTEDASAAMDAIMQRIPVHFGKCFEIRGVRIKPEPKGDSSVSRLWDGKRYVQVQECSDKNLRTCLLNGRLTLDSSPKYINFRLSRRQNDNTTTYYFDEFIELGNSDLGSDKRWRYRFDSAILYPGAFHYTAIVKNQYTGCYYFCNDEKCELKGTFGDIEMENAARQVTHLQYVIVDDSVPATDIIIPKQLIYRELQTNKDGFRNFDQIRDFFNAFLQGYTPPKKKQVELKQIKLTDGTCNPQEPKGTIESEMWKVIPTKFVEIIPLDNLSAAVLVLFNMPTFRNAIIMSVSFGDDPAGVEGMLCRIFSKMLYRQTPSKAKPIRIAKLVRNQDDPNLKLPENILKSNSVFEAFTRILDNISAGLRTGLEMVYEPWETQTRFAISIHCKKSGRLEECIKASGVSFNQPLQYLTIEIQKDPATSISVSRVFQPLPPFYRGKIEVGYELHTLVTQNPKDKNITVYLKSFVTSCWWVCSSGGDCNPNKIDKIESDEAWENLSMVVYAKSYPLEDRIRDEGALLHILDNSNIS